MVFLLRVVFGGELLTLMKSRKKLKYVYQIHIKALVDFICKVSGNRY